MGGSRSRYHVRDEERLGCGMSIFNRVNSEGFMIEIVCDRADHDHAISGSAFFEGRNRKAATIKARLQGWSLRGPKSICPRCKRKPAQHRRFKPPATIEAKDDSDVTLATCVDSKANCANLARCPKVPFVCGTCKSRNWIWVGGSQVCSLCSENLPSRKRNY